MPPYDPPAGRADARGPGIGAHVAGLLLLAAALLALALAPSARGAVGDLAFRGCFSDGGGLGCAPVSSLDGIVDVAVAPGGASAYAVSDTDDSITIFNRSAAGGLTIHSCVSAAAASGCAAQQYQENLDGASGVAVSPDGQHVYVASTTGDSLTTWRRTATGGLVGQGNQSAGPVLQGAAGVAVSPDGRSVYVASRDSGTVQRYDRSPSGSIDSMQCFSDTAVVGCTPLGTLAGARAVVVSPDGATVYVAASPGDAITAFSRAANGALTFRACYDDVGGGVGCTPIGSLNGVRDLALSPDGTSLYATGDDGSALTAFARDATGALTFRGCFAKANPGCTPVGWLGGVRSVAVSPDGASVYAASIFDSSLTVFSRDAGGALAVRGCLTAGPVPGCGQLGPLNGAAGVTVSPDGSSVYLAAYSGDAVSHLSRELPAGSVPRVGGGGSSGGVPAPRGVRCNGRQATLLAAGPLTRGTARADIIVGRAGRDRILGRGGADVICGGGGTDRLEGGPGRDLLLGQGGADILLGGAGRDVLRGGAGRDRLSGGPGRDALLGGPGVDRQLQ
jgi:DNA-binding beta-propeller fold protein YncE